MLMENNRYFEIKNYKSIILKLRFIDQIVFLQIIIMTIVKIDCTVKDLSNFKIFVI